jgi:DNA-binding XRE family transcriptional regulator
LSIVGYGGWRRRGVADPGRSRRRVYVMSISALVKQRREALKVSQADLAWLARVSRGTIGNIERGAVGSDSRTLPAVTYALGLDYLDTVQSGQEVERVPLFVARRIIQLILEVRDGSGRVQSVRKIARLNADAYLEFVEIFEDEGSVALDGDAKDNLSDLAEFVVPMLEDKSSADRKVLDWFHDLGWSEDDYDDWDSLKADVVLRDPAQEEHPLEVNIESSAALPDVPAGKTWSMEFDMSDLLDEIRRTNEEVQRVTGSVFDKAAAFDKLPLRVKDALMKGSLAESSVGDIKGGVYANLFVRLDDVGVPVEETLLSLKRWQAVKFWVEGAYDLLERRSRKELADPLELFDAIEVALISYATRPDILEYVQDKYPGRIEELKKRYPNQFTDAEEA